MKKLVKKFVLGLFFLPIVVYRFRCKQVIEGSLAAAKEVDGQFLLAQDQHGAIISLLTYADYWSRYRSKVQIIILSSKFPSIISLIEKSEINADVIVPPIFFNAKFNSLFQNILQQNVFDKIYKELVFSYPHLIYIYEKYKGNRTRYHSNYDSNLECVPKPLIDTYVNFRKIFDCRIEVINDFYKLVSEKQELPAASWDLPEFAVKLGITKPFVMLGINNKNYGKSHRNHRAINNFDFYKKLISCLHERGYQVVLFGDAEQKLLKSNGEIINYAQSPLQTMANDFLLAKSAEFLVSAKSGTEWLACMANRFMLGLNYSELTSMNPNKFMRYVPKGIKTSIHGKLTWREYLRRPEFFEIGSYRPAKDIEYIDLEPDMAVPILNEFCSFIKSNDIIYSTIQKEFKKNLGPHHMDSYIIESVPLNYYLQGDDAPS